MIVVPAIIPRNKIQLEEEIKKVSKFANVIQIDISDGIFTPFKTWPYNGNDLEYFDNLKSEIDGLPKWDDIDFEFHFMVHNPADVVSDYIHLAPSSIIVQIEALNDSQDDFEKIYKLCKENEVSIGLAIKPKTDTEKLKQYIEKTDFVQVMGNDLLGKHGTELDEKAIEKIKEIKSLYPEKTIAIDIGVNLDTKDVLLEAGATKLISGGAILEAENYFLETLTFPAKSSFKSSVLIRQERGALTEPCSRPADALKIIRFKEILIA